jgi:hypothetical protein
VQRQVVRQERRRMRGCGNYIARMFSIDKLQEKEHFQTSFLFFYFFFLLFYF